MFKIIAKKMPGFEMHRFVVVKDSDLDEFMCGICHEVFNQPLSSLCCGQTYCSDCIKAWICQKSICPMDRKTLMAKDLVQPPKALMNLLNKLLIRCDFHSRGCKVEINLADLDNHLKKCQFNPANFCQTCGLVNDTTHNCITALKLHIESINDESTRLRNENSYLNNIVGISPDISDRTFFILKSQIPKQLEEKAIEVSKMSLNKCKGSRVEMARNIAQDMDKQFGGGWNCFVTHGSNYGSVVKAYKDNYIQFKMGSNEIIIYQTSINQWWHFKLIVTLVAIFIFYYKCFN